MELAQLKTEGFFDLPKEERDKYLNYIYSVMSDSYETDTRNKSRYYKYIDHIIHLNQLEEYFLEEEDYEMCYIIKQVRERFRNNYGQQY